MAAMTVARLNHVFGRNVKFAVHTVTSQEAALGPCVTCAGEFTGSKGFHSGFGSYDSVFMAIVAHGWLQIEVEGKTVRINTGEIGLVDSVVPHAFSGSAHLDLKWVEITGVTVPAFLQILAPVHAAVFPVKGNEPAQGSFERIVNGMLAGKENEVIYSGEISRMLYGLVDWLDKQGQHDMAIVHEAMSYICSNFRNELSIDEIADHEKVSKYRLIRSFRQTVGVTPYAYIIQSRIDSAKWFLTNTTNKVNDIGRWCGFMNDTTFGVAFKKETGFTPRQWRNLHQFSNEA